VSKDSRVANLEIYCLTLTINLMPMEDAQLEEANKILVTEL